MNKEQARAIADLINNSSELRGWADLRTSDRNNYEWFVVYQFKREDGISDYDVISSLHAFYRWLGYRGKEALTDD